MCDTAQASALRVVGDGRMHTLILGAGVIGAATAYYLSLKGIAATVIERSDVACAASGKSGGFLARDWCDGQPQEALAHLSFELHDDLASELAADYGYRRITTRALAASALRPLPAASDVVADWVMSCPSR